MELSIKEKAKAYDDALKKAEDYRKRLLDEDNSEWAGEIEKIFPELKESEDERMFREIKRYLKEQGNKPTGLPNGTVAVSDMITWLEKQYEQKPQGKSALEAAQEEKVDNQNCVKPTDKIEPKFHEGDWVIDKQGIVHQIAKVVENVTYHFYGYDIVGGGYFNDNAEGVRLWKIQDTKDGDILAFDDEIIVIFKNLYNTTTFHSYCYVEEGAFNVSQDDIPDWWNGNGFHPATKEQSELLFKKIHEAGYEWDTEKKELKKIKKTDYESDALIEESYQQQADDLIDMVTEKPAWSEEDEDAIGMAIIALEDMYDEDAPNTTYGGYNLPFNKAAERLKSFKERYTWKPSEEQIEVLQDTIKAYNEVSFPTEVRILSSLCNELKKL